MGQNFSIRSNIFTSYPTKLQFLSKINSVQVFLPSGCSISLRQNVALDCTYKLPYENILFVPTEQRDLYVPALTNLISLSHIKHKFNHGNKTY